MVYSVGSRPFLKSSRSFSTFTPPRLRWSMVRVAYPIFESSTANPCSASLLTVAPGRRTIPGEAKEEELEFAGILKRAWILSPLLSKDSSFKVSDFSGAYTSLISLAVNTGSPLWGKDRVPASDTSQGAAAWLELEGLYRTPKTPTSMRRKPRRRNLGLGILVLEEAFFLLSFFPELCLLKGTLPENCNYGQKPFAAHKNNTAIPTSAPTISTVLGWT